MNWLAIGILSLLALSMMISSKYFRVIMGTLAVVVVTIVAVLSFLGMRALPSAGDLTGPFLTWKFPITKPNLRETAEAMSARILFEMDHDLADPMDKPVAESVPGDERPQTKLSTQATDSDEKSPSPQPPKRRFVFVEHFTLEPSINSSVLQEVTVQEKMASVIRAYLEKHHNPSLDPGVDQLKPEDLNWRLLDFRYKRDKSKAVKQVTIVFDDEFHNHVRERGRQLVTKDHLQKAGFASIGTLAMLTTLFGLLKLKQAKRKVAPAKDLLVSSGVWMV